MCIFLLVGCGADEKNDATATATATEESTETAVEESEPQTSKELTAFKITGPDTTTDKTNATPTITWEESDYADTTSLALTEDVTYDLKITSDSGCATVVQEHKDLTELSKTLDTFRPYPIGKAACFGRRDLCFCLPQTQKYRC